jgi:hypothetical protein
VLPLKYQLCIEYIFIFIFYLSTYKKVPATSATSATNPYFMRVVAVAARIKARQHRQHFGV